MPKNINSLKENHLKKSDAEMEEFKKTPMNTLKALHELIADVRDNIDHDLCPFFVVQARHDEMININSANIIYEQVESIQKELKWYEESGHVITLGKKKKSSMKIFFNFLKNLIGQL